MVDRVTVDKAIAWVVGVGASRGLGAAAARRFAREGLAVAVTGRSPEALAIIADEISTAGGHAIAAVGDVQDETGIIAILDRLENIGSVEVGVYNAGKTARTFTTARSRLPKITVNATRTVIFAAKL
jgi:NADP-dependent 3-hydroxy acid dehydrogenase YdfG